MRYGAPSSSSRRSSALLGVLAAVCLAPGALGQSFAPAHTYPAGTTPYGVVLADFNGDGKLDMACVNSGSDNVSIRLGNGDGTFGARVNIAVGDAPLGVAVGDFNRDGNPDLVVANASDNNISILVGNGSGGFGAPINFATGNIPYSPT